MVIHLILAQIKLKFDCNKISNEIKSIWPDIKWLVKENKVFMSRPY